MSIKNERATQILKQFTAEILRSSSAEILHLIKRDELSMPRMVTLMHLDKHGPTSISGISEQLSLSLGTTSHLVNQMVCKGFVTRTEDPNDRRLKLIALAERGHAFVDDVKQARITLLMQRMQTMPPELLAQALDVMELVTQHLQHVRTNETQSTTRAETKLGEE